jgi:hypothetical protein
MAVLFHVSIPSSSAIRYVDPNAHDRAALGALTFILFAFIVPGEVEPFDKGGSIDYVGSYFGVGGLVLFNFVWK